MAIVNRKVMFPVAHVGKVSGLVWVPKNAHSCFVLAHGAGAGMTHPFLASMANELAERGMATFRYQFPYLEARGRRPDPPLIAEATVRAAVREAAQCVPGLSLLAGGKSFGGRMTSNAQAREPLPGVRGIGFLGFPLHPVGKPSIDRGKHLSDVRVPLLFLQGANDKLADLKLLRTLCARLPAATLHVVDNADHSFHLPKRTGRSDQEVRAEIADVLVAWAGHILPASK